MGTSPFPPEAGGQNPVCVFCGSSPGSSALYGHAATSVGKALAEAGIPMVYGGGVRGLMGAVSQAALDAGGYVHGIVPGALTERNMTNTRVPPLSAANSTIGKSVEGKGKEVVKGDSERFTTEVVGSMHERKLQMAKLATGGFVVLPGGYGTFEEMMEMITWNQLGIHRLPVIVLNIGNLFTPLRTLLHGAVDAGFIQPENLALVHILDLPGGPEANSDESRVDEWGSATIKALKVWSLSGSAGYGLNWELAGPDRNIDEIDIIDMDEQEDFSLFTTMRYTSPDLSDPTLPIIKDQIPLLEYHFDRLEMAFAHFSERDGSEIWGSFPSRQRLWEELEATLTRREKEQQGDWRVRLLIHRGGGVEIQVVTAPSGAGPFQLHPTAGRSAIRPLLLDLVPTDIASESSGQRDSRLYKTTEREIYDQASARAASARPDLDHPEILLRTSTHLLETSTSNIAIQWPKPSGQTWVTPKLDTTDKPFLDGVMRRYLLAKGLIREQELTVDDWYLARQAGWRVIGFNGLRGVWEAQLF